MLFYVLSLPVRVVISLIALIVGVIALLVEYFTTEIWRKFLGGALIFLGVSYVAATYVEGEYYDPNRDPYLIIYILVGVLVFYLFASALHAIFKPMRKGSFFTAKRVFAMPKPPPPPTEPIPQVAPAPQVANQMPPAAVLPVQETPTAAAPVSIVTRNVAAPKTLDSMAGELPDHLKDLIGVKGDK